ncbi:MAG: hypothetical protein EKK42_19145 [Pseudonocardiaceae bacterium]|nr:MAG: hypothetical protein EKK42_19145 [Pseudonocardiaceae bacterium]
MGRELLRYRTVGVGSLIAVVILAFTIPPAGVQEWITVALGAATVLADVLRYRQRDGLPWQRRRAEE